LLQYSSIQGKFACEVIITIHEKKITAKKETESQLQKYYSSVATDSHLTSIPDRG
jgi:hypothetical protein